MPNPLHLATFAAIVDAGSISKAAARLGCGKSVVSRQLARLEAELGARLIQRTTRTLTLTEVGEAVWLEAQQIERSLSNVEQIAGQFQQEVRGRLRVTCPRPLGQRYLVPLVAAFSRAYPKVELTLQVEDRLIDLVAEQIDVALRVAHLEDSSLVARRIADNPRVLVAAPQYLEHAQRPQTPQDLAQHRCLLFMSGNSVWDSWTFQRDGNAMTVRAQGSIRVNDGLSLAALACAGAGVAVIDRLLVAAELASGALVELLPEYRLNPGPPIHAVYPARKWLPLKTAVFLEYLQAHLFEDGV
ncbi:LysR family transcriptional regulator [Tibeticola sp.]|jgi:DNA-binding transcriptional LysR family regulator|uniref:LysR family transcriptional regulator n=1 Tax=Tibeticola sp. TaxID=2005368 RepID=UPI00259067D9|nr:LysR family transcriptional regulator [Tibeticola sp.]MCI4439713.1 LysR family transcriptional regulator [Tibeticola sp.]